MNGALGIHQNPARWPGGKRLTTGHELYWWVEVALVAGLFAIYSTIRNVATSGAPEALDNAARVVDWQERLDLNHELIWQQWALEHEPLIIASNYFYGSAYALVTLGVLVWLFKRFPDSYPLWRNTLAAGTMLALVGFAAFPLMPPRLLDVHDGGRVWGFVDTLADYPTLWSFQSEAVDSVSNQFAAMPSLHCGWAIWACAALLPHLRMWWTKTLAVAYPVVTTAVVVITGNHYFLDAVGGALVIGAGLLLAVMFTRAGRSPRSSEPHPTS